MSLGSDSSATWKVETMHHHMQENYERELKAVQELEGHLGIPCRWVPEDEEWQAAARMIANWKYQWALDNLEQLVVSQIFELLKMNQAGTGKFISLELTSHWWPQAISFISTLGRPCKHARQPSGLPWHNIMLQPKPSAVAHWNSMRLSTMRFWPTSTFSGTQGRTS